MATPVTAVPPSEHAVRWWSPADWVRAVKSFWRTSSWEERQGYLFWMPTILILLTFELLGAVTDWFGHAIPWPTLSMTVGHLEKLWDGVAILVVGVITAALFQTLAFKGKVHQTRGRSLRIARRKEKVEDLDWYGWWLVLGASGAALLGCWAAGAATYDYGYAIYGTVLGLGFFVPGVLLAFARRLVAFPTLFYTAAALQRRLHHVTLVLTAGLAILTVHLAFYPWPSIQPSPSFAGLNPEQALTKAEAAVAGARPGKPALAYRAQARGVLDGGEAWYVYFAGDCIVTASKLNVTTSSACSR